MSTNYKPDSELIKILFQDVEESNVSRLDLDLLKLCNKKEYLYGEPATNKRRSIQKIFGEAKRKTHQQYLKYLGKIGVAPGEVLKSELLEPDTNEFKADNKYLSESEDDSSESSGSDNNSSSSSISTEKSSHKKEIIKFAKQQKRMQSVTDTFPADVSFSSDYSNNVLQTVEMLEKPEYKQDGTKMKPYVIIANPDKPETCAGFEVALVPQITVENFVRSVYHIRHVTTQGMEDEWSAIIPREDFPALAHRSVLIRGPSQELWHRRPDLYHEEKFCTQTAVAHESQQTAIKQSIVRLYSYWLLVLPKGTMLENYIISHDSVHVTKGTQEMTKAFETEDDSGKTELETLYGMDVYWRIAMAGGNMVSDPGSAAKKRRKKKTASKV